MSPADYRDDAIHMATGTWDGAGDGRSRLYIDGVLVATSVGTDFNDFSLIGLGSQHFGIGQIPAGGGFSDDVCNMNLDRGKIWDCAFTDAQVLAEYNANKI